VRILVAEDDPVSRRILEATLTRWGHDPVVVKDGTEAWRVMQGSSAPTLAILDWMMPGMDGLEVCTKVRERGDARPAYIIFLTAKRSRTDHVAGLQAGADDYILKPFDAEELRARVQVGMRVLKLQQSLIERVDDLQAALRRVSEGHEALRQSEGRLKAILDSSPDGVIIVDDGGLIRDFSHAAERMFGWPREQAIGRPLFDVMMPLADAEVRKGLSRQSDKPIEMTVRRKSGETFPVEVSFGTMRQADEARVSLFVHDLSGRRRLETGLREAQELESAGQLAAGIALELETPMELVGEKTRFLANGFASLARLTQRYQALGAAAAAGKVAPGLLEEIGAAEKEAHLDALVTQIPKAIDETLAHVERVASVVRAMTDFAGRDRAEKAPADLNRVVQVALTETRGEIRRVAEVDTQLGELPLVLCDAADLKQVFVSLLTNAAHAVDALATGGTRGSIRVRTWQEAGDAVISISDNGCGIPQQVRARIFEPFFTTKQERGGRGQGLPVARAIIVHKHGGSLVCQSAVGDGTTFVVRLPLGAPAAEGVAAP
jgi:PAS domain S-box-containing protein